MENICIKESYEDDKKSNISVLDLSLESNKEIGKECIFCENISDLKKDLMNEVDLQIENETIIFTEFILDDKDINIGNENNFENKKEEDTSKKEEFKKKKRNNSAKKNKYIKEDPLEYVSPLKLCRKTFGNIPKSNKKPNDVFCDFQKYILDNKSCNDEDSQDDFFLSYTETERSTPNSSDLSNLLNCRKKMALFRNSINDKGFKEYENILNSDNIFSDKDSGKSRKSYLWSKYIKQRLVSNRMSNKDSGLFILGLLESAVNERKGRYTTNI